jgi:crotonobetainyl-CoA:carnitine CoA-transferase CaiB-like acyl-CoA transferase
MPRPLKEEGELSGYRALDLTDDKGFLCGKILADLGADVIKVERPGGDPSRNLGPFYHDEPDPEKSLTWWAFNTSKRGITLDITTQEGRHRFLRLAKKSDFVIESFQPGYMAKLGLGYDALSKVNSRIILVSISGFGQEGPYSAYKAPDIVCTALGGYMYLVGDPDRPPLRASIPQAYLHAGNAAASGSLIALWHREITGQGQWVDVSAQECMAPLGLYNQNYWNINGIIKKRFGIFRSQNSSISLHPFPGLFPCKDGYVFFMVLAGSATRRNKAFIEWMEEEGMPDPLLKEIDWKTFSLYTQPLEKTLEIISRLEPFLRTKTKKELYEQALARGFLIGPVNSLKDVFEDNQLAARGFWQKVDHPELDEKIFYPGSPCKAANPIFQIRTRAPLIGEHNNEIFQEEKECPLNQAHTEKIQDFAKTEVFNGIKIADFSWNIVGPLSARYFADHGATVVKVESTQRPDTCRITAPFKDNTPGVNRGTFFCNYNINKYSMTLNLDKAEGISVAKRLISWADVFWESFSPGNMKKWGLDYDSVKDLNPGLVYASSSMMGQTGPYHTYAGYGVHASAISGFDDIAGWPDRGPSGVFSSYTDFIAPHSLITAILVALFQRKRTGKGQYLDHSQLEASVQFSSAALLDYAINKRIRTRDGNRDPYAAPHNAYLCAGEDRWCTIAVYTDEEWQAFCRVIGQPALMKDPKFATLSKRKENEDELDHLIEEWTRKLPDETVMDMMQRAGIASGVVRTAEGMHRDAQFKHRNHFWIFDHPVIGPHTVDALPIRRSKTPAKAALRAPCLGEHNEFVCSELLGLSNDDYVTLKQAGAFD